MSCRLQESTAVKRVDIETAISTLSQLGRVYFNKKLLFLALRDFVKYPKLTEVDKHSLFTFDKAVAKTVYSAKLLA